MKISTISIVALSGALLTAAPAAFAGSSMGYHSGPSYSFGSPVETADCPPGSNRAGDGTCMMASTGSLASGTAYGKTSSYSTGSTITSYASPMETADCPPGSNRAGDGTCMVSSGSSMNMGSTASRYSYSSAPLGSYQSQPQYVVDDRITSVMSDSEADYRYGSGSISQTYTDGSNTIVPFTTTSASLTNYRVPGMGVNEFLSPTQCPVNVYNPDGGQVLGCYQVSKPAPVRVAVPNYHTVRIVRPIIYVRYPVPTPLPMPMPVCGGGYGYGHGYYQNMHWGRRCGW